MNPRLSCALALACLALTIPGLPRPLAEPGTTPSAPLEAGIAWTDITPTHPVRLSGFAARTNESTTAGHALMARALAIRAPGGEPVVLVTVDNCAVPAPVVDAVAARLKAKLGLAREQVAVCSTHTHAAPCLTGAIPSMFGMDLPATEVANIGQYTRTLTRKLEQVALAAIADLRPARLGRAGGSIGFPKNRRPQGGPVDRSVPFLAVLDPNGAVRAVLATVACHCTTIGPGSNACSGDWAGDAAGAFELAHPGAVALITIGCGADANPDPRGGADSGVAFARQHGRELAAQLDRLLGGPLKPITQAAVCRSQEIQLPFETLPTAAEWRERAAKPGIIGHHARRALARLGRGEPIPTALPYRIQVWAFGDELAFVFLPGEVVVDYALRLRASLDPGRLWINAYANDVPCYIPSRRILTEGGYEAEQSLWYYDQPARLTPGVEDLICTTVLGLVPAAYRLPRE